MMKRIELMGDEPRSNEQLKEMVESGEIPADATALNLCLNDISEIMSLASLKNLTCLILDCNYITDVTPLASLTNLTELYLVDNGISDVTPLASLMKLTRLELMDNPIPQEQRNELQKALPNCVIIWEHPTTTEVP